MSDQTGAGAPPPARLPQDQIVALMAAPIFAATVTTALRRSNEPWDGWRRRLMLAAIRDARDLLQMV